jgi:peptidoglycan/xylan/chitin deacetylase (PgdA/CDA1 family)
MATSSMAPQRITLAFAFVWDLTESDNLLATGPTIVLPANSITTQTSAQIETLPKSHAIARKSWDVLRFDLGLLKETIKSALLGSGTIRAAQFLLPARVMILRYHSVREQPAELDAYISCGITHSSSLFRAQMEYVAQTCHPVTLDEIPEYVTGALPIPKRAVAITFDDGFRDNYEIAAPILERYGLRGAFYIATSSVEGRPLWFVRMRYWTVRGKIARPEFLDASGRCATLTQPEREEFMAQLEQGGTVHDTFTMTWAQARDLLERGHVIGSHTVHHPNLTKVPRNEMRLEMEESRKCLESELGRPVRHFSYPNPILTPHWNEETVKASHQAGYSTAVTSNDGYITKGIDILALPRQSAAQTFQEFVWNLEMGFCGRKQ